MIILRKITRAVARAFVACFSWLTRFTPGRARLVLPAPTAFTDEDRARAVFGAGAIAASWDAEQLAADAARARTKARCTQIPLVATPAADEATDALLTLDERLARDAINAQAAQDRADYLEVLRERTDALNALKAASVEYLRAYNAVDGRPGCSVVKGLAYATAYDALHRAYRAAALSGAQQPLVHAVRAWWQSDASRDTIEALGNAVGVNVRRQNFDEFRRERRDVMSSPEEHAAREEARKRVENTCVQLPVMSPAQMEDALRAPTVVANAAQHDDVRWRIEVTEAVADLVVATSSAFCDGSSTASVIRDATKAIMKKRDNACDAYAVLLKTFGYRAVGTWTGNILTIAERLRDTVNRNALPRYDLCPRNLKGLKGLALVPLKRSKATEKGKAR